MKRLLFIAAALALVAVAATSCEEKEPGTKEIAVTGVNIASATGFSVVVGETVTLTAEVLPEEATDKTVTWGVRTNDLISHEGDGVFKGKAPGEAEIWAKAGNITATKKIEVTAAPIRVNTVTMSETTKDLFVGKTFKLTFTLDPTSATNQAAVWSSDKPEFAEVAQDGTVTAKADGQAVIKVIVDEKEATCTVTVSTPEISDITTPYLKNVTGNTVTMEAEGFKTGDKIALTSYFGYSATVDVKNVTPTGAEFDLPAEATKDRSYTIAVMRDDVKKAEAIIRYDDDVIKMNKSLGWALTAAGEVTDDTSGLSAVPERGGYVSPAAVFTYNETDVTFDVPATDLKLCTFTPTNNALRLNSVRGLEDLSVLKNFDLTGVVELWLTDTHIAELDMTMFPNCEKLFAWNDPGSDPEGKRFKRLKLGTYGVDPVTKLTRVQLERNLLEGTIDMRQIPNLSDEEPLCVQDNRLTGIYFGEANVDPVHLIVRINATNNQIREFSSENCGKLRRLLLAGNPIERLTLLNNSKQAESMQYVYLLKGKEAFSFNPVSAQDAIGERVINVEQYWWRVFSTGNADELAANNLTEFDGGWVAGNPVVQALAAGYKVNCWTYNNEEGDGIDARQIHEHAGGTAPCNY